MKALEAYERPEMEVVDIDREDAILTSGEPTPDGCNINRGNPRCPTIDRFVCLLDGVPIG